MDEKFHIIEYSDINLHGTETLLKEQGLLLVDLGWFRGRTLMAMLNEEKKLRSRAFVRRFFAWRLLEGIFDIIWLVPLTVLSSKLIELHCIFVNHCSHWEWEKLKSGKYRFRLL